MSGPTTGGPPTASPAGATAPPRAGRGPLRSIGPGALVAAAFIGPGTVTTATLAGAGYGYALLWALGFSIVATIVLQEAAARIGLVTGVGLGGAVRRRFERPALRLIAIAVVLSAVAFGNAAYEMGNLLGASLGAEAVLGGGTRVWALLVGGVVFGLLWSGSYRLVERVLVALVVVMAVVFLATAAMLAPAADALLRGLLLPTIPDDGGAGLAVAVGLIGTTVVPYNLFLHASAVREKWGGADDGAGGHAHAGRVGDGAARPGSLRAARLDLTISIVLGGVVTAAIVVTSAAMRAEGAAAGVSDAAEMAVQLEPLLGSRARILFAIGLLAAGVTSATTAPLAAAYATAGALGWPRDLRHPRSRLVWIAVLGAGVLFALTGVRPVPAILFAQVANGVLLPAIAVFLILAANDRRWMGRWANGPVLNALGGLVVLVALVLGVRAVLGAL